MKQAIINLRCLKTFYHPFFSCLLGMLLLSVNAAKAQDSATTMAIETNAKALPLLWQQTAAEYRALCYQAFNFASVRLNQIPKRKFRNQQLAIITDLDETILDNSYSEAQLTKEGKLYTSASWKKWTKQAAATAVPGAVNFLQYASQKGATIFYISNRDTGDVHSTLQNLKKLNLPNADTAFMLFKSDSNSKEIRRLAVMKNYKVIMLLGDNLNDFLKVFETETIANRFAQTDLLKAEWGKKFIVLPNSTYGEWENALYNYERKTLEQKQKLRVEILKGY